MTPHCHCLLQCPFLRPHLPLILSFQRDIQCSVFRECALVFTCIMRKDVPMSETNEYRLGVARVKGLWLGEGTGGMCRHTQHV